MGDSRTRRADRDRVRLAMLAVGAAAGLSLLANGVATGAAATPKCFGRTATIVGTQQGETIRGTTGPDVIVSLGGDDQVLSRQGKDYVCSGNGNDKVHGAEGYNRLDGGSGNDWLDGRRGPGNIVIGGGGADHIQAEGKLIGGSGNDIIESYGYLDPGVSPVPDVTIGGDGNDQIYGCGGTPSPERPATAPGPPRQRAWAWPGCYTGGAGNDELFKGSDGDDRIFGGGGNDQLHGNDDRDRLYGEDGNDRLRGGKGTDICEADPSSGTSGCI